MTSLSFGQIEVTPTVTVTASTHVLKLDYNASVTQPGTSTQGAVCAPVSASAVVSNPGNWEIEGYSWSNSGTPPLNTHLLPGEVWINQGGNTANASGFSFSPSSTYNWVTCTVSFYNPTTGRSTTEQGQDWVVTFGGQLVVSAGGPQWAAGDARYLNPDNIGAAPFHDAGNGPTAWYLEYFGSKNVPNLSATDPLSTFPSNAEIPDIGYLSTTPQPESVTIDFSCGAVEIYQSPGSVTATIAAEGPSFPAAVVPHATFYLNMIAPGGGQVMDTCNDCSSDMPNPELYRFTAHQPTVVTSDNAEPAPYYTDGPYGVKKWDTMTILDDLGDPMGNIYAQEAWSSPGQAEVNKNGDGWQTTPSGTFLDKLHCGSNIPWTVESWPDSPLAQSSQGYWGGTESTLQDSGVLTSTYIIKYWTDWIVHQVTGS